MRHCLSGMSGSIPGLWVFHLCQTIKTEEFMKEFLKIMEKDIMSENFSRMEYVVYGIVAPLVLVLLCGLVGSF